MRCTTAREQIQRLMIGGQPAHARKLAVLAHLARCPQCRHEWRSLQQLRLAARRLPSSELSVELRGRVLAEIANMPAPTSADATPADTRNSRGTRMIQRTLIAGVCLTAMITTLLLLAPHRNGGVLAMGDVRKALEHVNTWHLKGWKREGDKEIPWEVWGRRTPFFYHERFGERETLDDGKNRTIVFPANTSYGNKQPVMLKIPSRPNTQSSMGLSFVLGLDRQNGNSNSKPWAHDADTETYIREEMIIGSDPAVQVNGLLTFEKGSPLPIRYEHLMRSYHVPKNAQGAFDFHNLPENAKEKEWTGTHLDAQYDLDLDGAAFQITVPADARQIDAVREASSPEMPARDTATKNGLTLHLLQARVDPKGNVLLCFEGFVGNVNFKGARLPFSFDTAVTNLARMTRDNQGHWQISGSPGVVIAHDERGRGYVAVTTLEFLRYTGERAWLALAPLDPLQPGAAPPHRLSFEIEMSVTTTQPVPEVQSNIAVDLLREVLPLNVELPTTYAEMDLKALSRQYGSADNIEKRGFTSHFETAAVEARADAWQDVARETLSKAIAYERVGLNSAPQPVVNPAGKREAEQALHSAIHYAQVAAAQLPSQSARRIQSNLAGLKQQFSREMAPAH